MKYKVHFGCYKLSLLDSYCGVFEEEVQQEIDLIGLLLTLSSAKHQILNSGIKSKITHRKADEFYKTFFIYTHIDVNCFRII